MVLGTYHMSNANHDYVKTNYRDVLDEGYQRQIQDVVTRLLRYRPTHVAVEVEPGQMQGWQERCAAFQAGCHELGATRSISWGFAWPQRWGTPGSTASTTGSTWTSRPS